MKTLPEFTRQTSRAWAALPRLNTSKAEHAIRRRFMVVVPFVSSPQTGTGFGRYRRGVHTDRTMYGPGAAGTRGGDGDAVESGPSGGWPRARRRPAKFFQR